MCCLELVMKAVASLEIYKQVCEGWWLTVITNKWQLKTFVYTLPFISTLDEQTFIKPQWLLNMKCNQDYFLFKYNLNIHQSEVMLKTDSDY